MSEVTIRRATQDDVEVLAYHRAAMFLEMGRIGQNQDENLMTASREYFVRAVPAGEYVAFLCECEGRVVAGGGVQPRKLLPRPTPDGKVLGECSQGLIMNVYTEIPFRRQGLAARIILEIVAWSKEESIPFLVLHASDAGRPVYEKLGFKPTNELGIYVGAFDHEWSLPVARG